MTINLTTYAVIARDFIFDNLLPDVCQVYATNYTANDFGGYSASADNSKQYQSSTNVPCRLDPTRTYRDTVVIEQEATLADYVLNLPYDFDIAPDDTVVHNGLTYTVKRIIDDNTLRVVRKAFVTIVR